LPPGNRIPEPQTLGSQCNVLTNFDKVTAMAANQMVQTRIDGAIKEEAAAVLAAMGLTLSDAVRLLLTRVAHDKALPFEPLIPNATTIQAMKDAGSGLVTKAESLDALFVDLNSDT
jgi:DNA-damage-inducible protein J